MKKIICILGIIVSIAIIILGINTYSNAGSFFTAENMICEVGGLLLISIGGINLCNSLKDLSDTET